MKKWILLICILALLLAGCGNAAAPAADAETTAASQSAGNLADFTVFTEDGDPVKLSDYLGTPIVLNFWASWCGPCKSEMPAFQAAWETYGQEVQFLMVDIGERVDEGAAFIATAGYTFPVLYDVNADASYTYQVSAIPTSYFIDRNGNVVSSHVGAMPESDLLAAIEAIR